MTANAYSLRPKIQIDPFQPPRTIVGPTKLLSDDEFLDRFGVDAAEPFMEIIHEEERKKYQKKHLEYISKNEIGLQMPNIITQGAITDAIDHCEPDSNLKSRTTDALSGIIIGIIVGLILLKVIK